VFAVFELEMERAMREIGVEDAAVAVFGTEALRLLLHVVDELRALNTFREARKIFHLGGDGKLAAGFMPFQNKRFQVCSGGIDGGGIPGTPGAQDDYIENVTHSESWRGECEANT
jgi:hypothetical protein